MGSPDFAVSSFEKIISSKHQIVGVVTQPDKAKGRGLKLHFTPIKSCAIKHELAPILQPVHLKDEKFIQELKALRADIYVVVAFRILPDEVFSIPKKGTINLHPSLLPKYRGAAPINWTIINGEMETGVTIIQITREIDAGSMLLQRKIQILPDETAGSLHDRLAVIGADLLLEALDEISDNKSSSFPQDSNLATPAPKIRKETCHISFNQPAENVKNWIHGLSPYPAAFVSYKDKIIKLYRAKVYDPSSTEETPGSIIKASEGQLFIGCQPGIIEILELQMEGKKKLSTTEFLRGQSLKVGERFN